MKPAMLVVLVLTVCLYLLLPPASSGIQHPEAGARPVPAQDTPVAGARSADDAPDVGQERAGIGERAAPAQAVLSGTQVCLPFLTSSYEPGANHLPNVPASPAPPDGSVDQGVDVALSWVGGDPDGDAVTYDVYLEAGDDTPGVLVCGALTGTTCAPNGLEYGTEYYWQVVAADEHGASVAGPVWQFGTGPAPNNPPHTPFAPSPADGATDQDVDLALSWLGGDPDGDEVTYDVYLEAGDGTPEVMACGAVTATVCVSSGLAYETGYSWQVVALDEHGASMAGPVWAFTTTLTPSVLLDEDFEDGWDGWIEFLNYVRLAPGQWYWDAAGGYNGSAGLTQNAYAVVGKEAEDALAMWLGPGAEEWTDYRLETRIILHTENYPHGVWVRGQYQDTPGDPGGWVTGYYIEIGGDAASAEHFVNLSQIQTLTDCWDPYCQEPWYLYDFNTPHTLTTTVMAGPLERDRWYTLAVEVNGDNIKVWLDGVLYIDYVDVKEPFLAGTVGFKTYKADTVTFDDLTVTSIE